MIKTLTLNKGQGPTVKPLKEGKRLKSIPEIFDNDCEELRNFLDYLSGKEPKGWLQKLQKK